LNFVGLEDKLVNFARRVAASMTNPVAGWKMAGSLVGVWIPAMANIWKWAPIPTNGIFGLMHLLSGEACMT